MGKSRRRNIGLQSTVVMDDTYVNLVDRLQRDLEERNATILEYQQQLKDKEIECLQKEISLLRSQPSTSIASNNFSFNDIESALPNFNGEDGYSVSKWIEDFENISSIIGLSDIQKLVYGRRLISGTASAAIRAAPDLRCWSQFKDYLIGEFKTSINSADIHFKLMERKKRASESYLDYLFSIYEIGKRGRLEDNAIISYAIKGIQDSELNKAILYSATNFEDFKEKLKIYATIKDNSKSSNNGRHNNHLLMDKRKGKNQSSSNNTTLCYNCGNRGHLAKDCSTRDKGPKCFQCGIYGHRAINCNKKVEVCEKRDIALVSELKRNDVNLNKTVIINQVNVNAFLDTGSDLSFVREDTYRRLNLREKLANPTKFQGIGSKELKTLGSFSTVVNIDGYDFKEIFHVVSQNIFPKECVLGKTLLNEAVITISPNEFYIKPLETKDNENDPFLCMQVSSKSEVDLSHVSDKNISKAVENLVEHYKINKIKSSPIQMRLMLRDEAPIWQNPRRLAPAEKEFVNQQMDEWLRDGIIQESSSDFASPIVIVRKKDGSRRICVDYRAINKVIIKDRYPLPLIDDNIDRLQGANIFSTLDLKNGFFHVPVSEESRKYTAFVTPNGHYEFLRVPFGLCNSPAVYQRFVNKIFESSIRQGKVLAYVDDLVIPAKDESEAYSLLSEILDIASKHGLEIKWPKCQLLQKRISYLGYEIQNGGIKPSTEKTQAVREFPEPQTIKQLQSFLGLTGYFRRFIENYSLVAKPLSDLLRKDEKFQFGAEQKKSFEELKAWLCRKPVLSIYREDAPTELHTDASKMGYGAVLLQKSAEDNQYHPVYFFSRKTSKCEENYTSYELEVLAIINALKKLRVYLIGIEFTIVTDCSAFKNTMSRKELCPRIARWALVLEDFNYKIEHRAGKSMKHVDALSRVPRVMMMSDNLLLKIKAAQRTDSKVKLITEILKHTQYEGYFLEGDTLFKQQDDRKLFYVPKLMEAEIIRSVHEQGHYASKKVEYIINQDYFIPKLKDKVQTHIKNCVKCILAAKEGKKEGFLHPIPKENIPLQTYHLDHLGPLSTTDKNYKHIFAVVDAFSKFVWLYPTRTTNSAEVIMKLNQQQIIFGNPQRVITDKGPAFTSVAFKEYCKEQSIEHVQITTGVPRGNGQVERIHRVVKSALTKLSSENPSHWYKHLEKVQRFINSNFSRSTGYTPFQILCGVKMRNKEDLKLVETIYQSIVDSFHEERNELRAAAASQILRIQEENCKNFNKRRCTARKYNIGDVVAIKRTQFGSKLKTSPKYLGPYKVVAVRKNERYEVEKIGYTEGPIHTSSSADNMKPFMIFEDEDSTDEEFEEKADCGNEYTQQTQPKLANQAELSGNDSTLQE